MLSHVFIGVSDFERAYVFYGALMKHLGATERFCDRTRPWAGWQSAGGGRPLLLIGSPYDGEPHQPGNGQMVALAADNRAQVRAAYRAALAGGGRDAGAPGLRPHYHAAYYGAYLYDPDGNKLCVVCHQEEYA